MPQQPIRRVEYLREEEEGKKERKKESVRMKKTKMYKKYFHTTIIKRR